MAEFAYKEIDWILDFCGSCGILLPSPGPTVCPNCSANVEKRESRAQGVFKHDDAQKLIKSQAS